MKSVSLFMDVEDPINPLADDAALHFADIFSQAGVRGTFCVTGEKCRRLLQRGRQDVLASLGRHCLGLHTDTHSYHPTTMELLADLDFESGCRAALDAERKGLLSFVEAFGQKPAFWGGAGNTWSPEVAEVLPSLGIPAYSYALTELPNKPIHTFNGSFALPQHVSIGEDRLTTQPSAIGEVIAAISLVSQPWVGVFVGHPTRYRYPSFWDSAYNGGATPESPSFLAPVEESQYRTSMANMAKLLTEIAMRWRVVGVDEPLAMDWRFTAPTPSELDYFEAVTARNIEGAAKWPIHRPGLDIPNIVAKTMAHADTLRVGGLDES